MHVNFGKWVTNQSQRAKIGMPDVVWRANELINGHMLVVGGSGTGKTYNIRKIVRSFIESTERPLRIQILDVHDDIDIDFDCSECLFSETSEFGLNPLEIESDMDTGGVRKGIQRFIYTINKASSRPIGDRQESVLRALLEDLYAANGFYIDKPQSWSCEGLQYNGKRKKHPTIDDLYNYTFFKYKQNFLGGSYKTSKCLSEVNKFTQKMQKICMQAKSAGHMSEFDEKELDKLKDGAITSYSDYVISIKTGRELDNYIKYDNKAVLKSVLDRIDNLRNCGIFKNTPPNFDKNKTIWRYRLRALGSAEKKMFGLFKLQEIYNDALKNGLCNYIKDVVVIDEANIFFDTDPDNILNILANEIRKFGVALICASQSFSHFSNDFIAACACKIVLGLDEMYWEKQAKQLQIKKEMLAWIKPQRSALVNLKRNSTSADDPLGDTRWFPVDLRAS
ncbi:MAG: ATP-binding protein [Endozoicomonadaceae bacterium]|nr:ATP-binding protein [Endozoicomonadaceae bacterium]